MIVSRHGNLGSESAFLPCVSWALAHLSPAYPFTKGMERNHERRALTRFQAVRRELSNRLLQRTVPFRARLGGPYAALRGCIESNLRAAVSVTVPLVDMPRARQNRP